MQIFTPASNTLARLGLAALVVLPLVLVALAVAVERSEYRTGQNRTPIQPVAFSHQHHAAEIGIDCRYCHTGVEDSAHAGLPPTSTCMTCHSQLWTNAAMLAPVRDSFASGARLNWQPVNTLPDYVYFDHSVHVKNGVGCFNCHGAVGDMPLMRQAQPLTMGWCLSCHRDPGPHLSPPDQVFRPVPPDHTPDDHSPDKAQIQALLARYGIDAAHLTDCSVCHR